MFFCSDEGAMVSVWISCVGRGWANRPASGRDQEALVAGRAKRVSREVFCTRPESLGRLSLS